MIRTSAFFFVVFYLFETCPGGISQVGSTNILLVPLLQGPTHPQPLAAFSLCVCYFFSGKTRSKVYWLTNVCESRRGVVVAGINVRRNRLPSLGHGFNANKQIACT